jgi:ribosomal protein L12E/L44/L45/RPP1/RPP2
MTMEMIYATLILEKGNKEINFKNLSSVLNAAGYSYSEKDLNDFLKAISEYDLPTLIENAEKGFVQPVPKIESKKVEQKEQEQKKEKKVEETGISILFGDQEDSPLTKLFD